MRAYNIKRAAISGYGAKSILRVIFCVLLSIGLLTCVSFSVSATVVGDFEYTGLPGGAAPEASWTGTGRTYTATSFGSINPTVGNRLAVIRNDNRTTNGTAPVAANTLETFTNSTDLNTFENSFRVSGGGENPGSGLTATFAVGTNDSIVFDWYFTTREDTSNGFGNTFNDFGFYTLTTGGSVTPVLLADANNSINSGAAGVAGLAAVSLGTQGAGNVNGGTFNNGTGWQTVTISGLAAGNYTLSFGVINVGDNSQAWPSALLIDNVQVIPEPSTVIAGALLALLIAFQVFKKFKEAKSREMALQRVPVRSRK